ncbi:MAG TPA: CPBP family intramembrane glutamic endopeptidase [Candidatus Limnocylindrales bacterium]|nr:CPBP family intramembrane glutamic endopeptidase [Candidatus Limnocylindrales bacterium]
MHWDYILILAVLAVVVPWRSAARIRDLLARPETMPFQRIPLYLSTIGFQWTAVAVIFWRASAHHVSLSALGIAFPYPSRAIFTTIGLSAILVTNQIYGVRRVAALPHENRGLIAKLAEKLLPTTSYEALVAILLVLTVSICEEFIYRGFAQTIFTSLLSGSQLAGALISAVLFSLAHLYQGRKGLITTLAVGLIFSGARIWTGSLLPSIIVHFAVDFSVGLAASKLISVNRPVSPLLAMCCPYCGLGARR